jgi:competence protein ComGF
MTKHFKAFTILEALISLMLISIIIALSYSLINLIGQQLSLYEKENTQVLEYNLFNTTLKYDIETSTDFDMLNTEQLVLSYYNKQPTTYTFTNKAILREHTVATDTFKIQTNEVTFINQPNSKNSILNINLTLLKDIIHANYIVNKEVSELINNRYSNED